MEYEQQAIRAWNDIVLSAGDVYTDDLMMGICRLNMCGHWKDDLDQLKEEYKHLEAMRNDYEAKPENSDFSIHHFPVRRLKTGAPLSLKVTLTGMMENGKVLCSIQQQNGTFREYEMNSSESGRYSIEILSESPGPDLAYFIKAINQEGKIVCWPENGPMNPIRVIFSDDDDPPSATIDRVTTAKVGLPIKINATVRDPSGINWVRLRYRHVTQYEDYRSVDMKYDETTGKFKAEIPGDFVINQWDLMYFIECMDDVGNGRMYPDLEEEMPYIIIRLKRD
jgi:hypothetical protein